MLTNALLCVMVVECLNADMAKLADAPDLGSGSERSEGSSPFIRTENLIVKNTAQQIARAVCFLWI